MYSINETLKRRARRTGKLTRLGCDVHVSLCNYETFQHYRLMESLSENSWALRSSCNLQSDKVCHEHTLSTYICPKPTREKCFWMKTRNITKPQLTRKAKDNCQLEGQRGADMREIAGTRQPCHPVQSSQSYHLLESRGRPAVPPAHFCHLSTATSCI